MHKVRTHLAEIKWTAYFELAASLAFLLFIGRYVVDTFAEIQFFLPGLLLLVLTVVSLVFSSLPAHALLRNTGHATRWYKPR